MAKPSLPVSRPAMSGYLQERFGGESLTRAYYDEREQNVVAIVEATGAPSPGLATYATASLHVHENLMDQQDIRVELMMVSSVDAEQVANVVATSAFLVMKDGWLAAPGVVFPNAVREYFPKTSVPHLMWTEPFDFSGLSTVPALDGLDFDTHPLQGVPLSEAERDFLLENGVDALTERLESASAAHFDLNRESVC